MLQINIIDTNYHYYKSNNSHMCEINSRMRANAIFLVSFPMEVSAHLRYAF
jgi:hypothetical protein